MLRLENIVKTYVTGELRQTALKGVSISFREHEFVSILGQSGSGKTTLLNIIGGIETPDSGSITIHGETIGDMNEKSLTLYRRKHLGYIFQMYNLIPNLNIKENIEVGAYLSDSPLDVDDLLKTLGLYEHRHKLPNQLSGGQQQRTAIGRAIVKNPDILLCDEPTGALDSKNGREALGLLRGIADDPARSVVMVTHDLEAASMADRILVLKDGRVVRELGRSNPTDILKALEAAR